MKKKKSKWSLCVPFEQMSDYCIYFTWWSIYMIEQQNKSNFILKVILTEMTIKIFELFIKSYIFNYQWMK